MKISCEAYNSVCVGPRALPPLSCVGARRSRCRAPAALCAGPQRSLCRAPRSRGALCVGPSALCVGLCRAPLLPAFVSISTPTSHPRATYPVPWAPSSDPYTHPARRVPFFQKKTVWGISIPAQNPNSMGRNTWGE